MENQRNQAKKKASQKKPTKAKNYPNLSEEEKELLNLIAELTVRIIVKETEETVKPKRRAKRKNS